MLSFQRQQYCDYDNPHIPPRGCDAVQIKYDGIWCHAVITTEDVSYYSRNGKLKKRFANTHAWTPCIVLGEYMFGSQWSQDPQRKEKLFVFDVLQINSSDIDKYPYYQRINELKTLHLPESWKQVQTYPADQAPLLWDYCLKFDYEGLVWRNTFDPFAVILHRTKRSIEDDFYICAFYEGEGRNANRLGAIGVSQIPGGFELMRVGGGFSDSLRKEIWKNRDKYLHKCVKIKGKLRFTSGAFRHPNFVDFHPEK